MVTIMIAALFPLCPSVRILWFFFIFIIIRYTFFFSRCNDIEEVAPNEILLLLLLLSCITENWLQEPFSSPSAHDDDDHHQFRDFFVPSIIHYTLVALVAELSAELPTNQPVPAAATQPPTIDRSINLTGIYLKVTQRYIRCTVNKLTGNGAPEATRQ